MVFSFCPSVHLSVLLSVTPFWLCSHHHIIMKFSGFITNDQSKVHAKGQGQRSKVKVTTQLNRFRTATPVWIHQWLRNDAQSLKQHRRGALLFFKVIHQISRSHSLNLTQIGCFRTVTQVWIHQWPRNDAQSLKKPYCFSRPSVKFQGHTALKIVTFDPNWAFPDSNS